MIKKSLDEFTDPNRVKRMKKLQIELTDRLSEKSRVIRRKPRDPREIELLIQAMLTDFEKWERMGGVIRNGRKWTIHF